MSRFQAQIPTAVALGLLIGWFLPVSAHADLSEPRVGPYVKAGVNIGEPDLDAGGVDAEVGGGVSVGGGYFFTPWIAAQLDFDYLGGSDLEVGSNDVGEADYWAITVNTKGYPMAAIQPENYPNWLQPYALFGIGGGEFETELNNANDVEDGTFIARFGLGTDFLVHENIGTYVEGGYHVASEDRLDGVGIFTLGAFYRF